MEKFTNLTGIAAPLPMINVDTDMILPKNYMKTISRKGLGAALFADLRYDARGAENRDFVLNNVPYGDARILVSGANFGCGSSREHAPWALLDFGIRCIIAPSFADIFLGNCFKNGILPIALPQGDVDVLMADARNADTAVLTVDLLAGTIVRFNGERIGFEIDRFRRQCLLDGVDEIAMTLNNAEAVSKFETQAKELRPWV
ncbi:3-isopropylmalate dehydratase small subunit [Fluviibacterium sp. DFM31]|uniref:3-isopropylmalate dehydratase small subunit n=1 Tax=Meridianimarinicoccus marinus TaxID=3231483 RepID=A0ABV3LBT2_9RHOB